MFPELEGPTKGRGGPDIGLGTFAREKTYLLGQIPAPPLRFAPIKGRAVISQIPLNGLVVYLLYHIPSSQVIRALTPLRQN